MEDPARPNDGRPTHTGEAQSDENQKAQSTGEQSGEQKNPPAGGGGGEKTGSSSGELSDDEILERAEEIRKTRAAKADEI